MWKSEVMQFISIYHTSPFRGNLIKISVWILDLEAFMNTFGGWSLPHQQWVLRRGQIWTGRVCAKHSWRSLRSKKGPGRGWIAFFFVQLANFHGRAESGFLGTSWNYQIPEVFHWNREAPEVKGLKDVQQGPRSLRVSLQEVHIRWLFHTW